ncbi:MAG: hydrogenase iron-sulfur subunit [Dehalococcoidia bacterium]|nr:hydrogenase iron-sulfur subunit [Dehalococcoidia bacterium]
MSKNGFEPKIVVFCCNWCSYAGADLAGISRLKMKPQFRIIRTMCSGRVDPALVLYAFNKGADGVLVAGCHPGDCHYGAGNYKARRRMAMLTNMLTQLGIEPARLRLEWISASEGPKFQSTINQFIDQITQLGPFNKAKEAVGAK